MMVTDLYLFMWELGGTAAAAAPHSDDDVE